LISDLFYSRRLSDERCLIVAGRRFIPSDHLPDIAATLEATRAAGRKARFGEKDRARPLSERSAGAPSGLRQPGDRPL
jgi:hypothetical protein